jgi:hypothetical protein
MGIMDGEYRPREDLFARALSLLTTLWGFPIFLVITWCVVSVCDTFTNPRLSGIVFGAGVILMLIATLVFAAQCTYLSIRGLRQRRQIGLVSRGSWKRRMILSLTTAVAAWGLPFLSFVTRKGTAAFLEACAPIGLLLSIVWCATTAQSFARYGKRALWLLAGLPFALYFPFWIAALWGACLSGRGCI